MKTTSEKAFETYIEETMIGNGEPGKWHKLDVALWDKQRAFFPAEIIGFIRETQPELYGQMFALHSDALDEKLAEALVKEISTKGKLDVLRHGFKFYGKTFKTAYFKPAHELNPEVISKYDLNRLGITRQVPCNPAGAQTMDMVFSINGLPVATCELKTPAMGQNWQHAVKQYRTDRDQRWPLFAFKTGALVHFATDPEEVHMSTRLSGEKTHFLPFNRGSDPGKIQCGKGNPQHPSGHRSAYFWEEVLQKDNFMNILGNYMFIQKKEEKIDDGEGGRKKIKKETMIFPRYHQLDSVEKLVGTARREGAGHNYLIQHSAGSGKTNSISWLSHRLASIHNAYNNKVFDCVVVITDRQILDRQLQDAIYQIEHAQGVVKPIDKDSKQLAEALIDGTKIVITTLQKFPFILKGLLFHAGAKDPDSPGQEALGQSEEWKKQIARRNYAIVVDEAHSSQTGETARELKEILGYQAKNEDQENEPDWEDRLNEVMESRGRQRNLSFFAFTATPKGKTLELFGRNKEPFHIYSMRQAIEEKYIKDVLKHYTSYKSFFQIAKKVADDPTHKKKKAIKKLAKFLALHPVNISQKTEIIIEHFRATIKDKINGRAKAMVVTGSRLHAVRYMLAFKKYITQNGYDDVNPVVAFSGKVKDPDTGLEYTEPGMNIDPVTNKAISEKELPEKFDTMDYQILLVANKYQTGFDQPLLLAMYVDKRLDGVQAVQTLSRLNRTHPAKDDPFVLDFVNERDDILTAFKPFYDRTDLNEESDPQLLEQWKHDMDQLQVYHQDEILNFAKVFYKPYSQQKAIDNALLSKFAAPAKDRFKALQEDEADIFRDRLSAFVKGYAFISQIIPYGDQEMEMLYSFGRFLLPLLPKDGGDDEITHPEHEVDLAKYRTQKIAEGAINISEGDPLGVDSITEAGTGRVVDEKKPLSEIIQVVNERFGTQFTEEDILFFEQIKEKAVKHDEIRKTAEANPLDKFQLGIKKLIDDFMIQRMSENDVIVTRYLEDNEYWKAIFPILTRGIWEEVRMGKKLF
jgi:type I restriction enzyme R subunit